MSFTDAVDLEAQIPYSDSPEFERLGESVSSSLFDINASLVKLSSILKAFDKKKDDVKMEEQAVDLADQTRDKFKVLGIDLKRLQTWPESLPQQRFTQQKLSNEFSVALSEFQDLQRSLAERQRSSIIRAKTNIATYQPSLIDEEEQQQQDEHSGGGQSQAQALKQDQLSQEEVDYQQALITERENEIADIEQGIEELNEIFTDLGTIITEQGTIIDNIEANMYNVAQSTRDASTQLTRAARSQRNSRGRAFCLLLILIVVLTVIILAMFLG